MKPHVLRKLQTNPTIQNSIYEESTQVQNYLSAHKYNRDFLTKNNRNNKNKQFYSLQAHHMSQSPYLQRMINIRNANKKKDDKAIRQREEQQQTQVKQFEKKRPKNQTPLTIFKKSKDEIQKLNQLNPIRSLSNNSHYNIKRQTLNSNENNNLATFKLPKIDHQQSYNLQKQSIQSATLQFTATKKNKVQLQPLNVKNKKIYKFATKTKAGTNGKQPKINQDVSFIEEKFLFGLKCYCVCDGHGLNGHLVSSFIKINFIKNLTTTLKKHKNSSNLGEHPSGQKIQELIYNTLIKTNQMLLDSDINTQLSGSTVVCIFIYNGQVFCFNVGDSRAIICQRYQTHISTPQKEKNINTQKKQLQNSLIYSSQEKYKSQMLNSKNFKEILNSRINQNHQFNLSHSRKLEKYQWKLKQLSIDQKPQRKDEFERIIKNGGRIQCNKNQKNEQIGPLRVWIKDIQMPGLAMTRSFGDKAGIRAGTTGQPQIIQHQILPQDKFIIIASDGVWQYLQNEQVMNIMIPYYQNGDLEGGADKIVKIATQIWSKISLSRDDITVIVVLIN